jgi:hypothetical protein
MYRAGPTAGGLPLPRAGLGAFTATVGAVAVLAFLFPWVLLFSRGPADGWMTFKNGGIGMWLLALLDVGLPVALGIAGAVVVRGKRVPSGLFFGVAVIPLFVSILFGYLALRSFEHALGAGISLDPTLILRIDAAALGEAMSLDQFGGFITCGCALIGSVALASAVASIDVTTATRSDGQRPTSVFGAATLVSGAAWFVATIVITALRLRTVGLISICVVLTVGLLVPFAVFAARAASVLRGWHDAIEARRASAALVVSGMTALLAVLVLERAIAARVGSDVFNAVSGESIDASQRARILMELVDTRRWASIAYGIHAVLGTATFGLAVAGAVGPARGPGAAFRHPVSPSTIMAASVGVFVLGATFALNAARARTTELIAGGVASQSAPKGVTLPRIDASVDEGRTLSSEKIVLNADGTNDPGVVLSSIVCSGGRTVTVFADRMATFEMLAKRFPDMPSCSLDLVFAATAERDRSSEARLGDLAPFARNENATIAAHYDRSGFGRLGSNLYLKVRALEDETIEYEGNRVKLPLGPSAPAPTAGFFATVRYVFRPTDTIGHVVRVIVAMKQRFPAAVGTSSTHAEIEIDWPPKPSPTPAWSSETTNLPAGVQFLTPVVSGRLPPEVITRIVRLNAPKIRACYGEGLKRDPRLSGTVRVKFVIDRTGSVVTVQDAASTLPDRDVTSCIARTFSNLTFPQPEGGIVLVTYGMTLAP